LPGTSEVENTRNDPGAARLRMALLPFRWMAVENYRGGRQWQYPPPPLPGISGGGQDGDFFRSGVTGKYITYPIYIQLACNMGQVVMSIHVCGIRGYSSSKYRHYIIFLSLIIYFKNPPLVTLPIIHTIVYVRKERYFCRFKINRI
jgi:hypothetical protein